AWVRALTSASPAWRSPESASGRASGRRWWRCRWSCDLREQRCVAVDAAPCHIGICRVQLDEDRVTLQAIGNESGCAGAAERVQNNASSWSPCEDARLDQRRRERGEVRLRKRLRGDFPYAAAVACVADR